MNKHIDIIPRGGDIPCSKCGERSCPFTRTLRERTVSVCGALAALRARLLERGGG